MIKKMYKCDVTCSLPPTSPCHKLSHLLGPLPLERDVLYGRPPTDVSTYEEAALRTAVQRQSLCGGQGFVKCNCAGSGRCKSNRCKCFKTKVNYNSRCHASM